MKYLYENAVDREFINVVQFGLGPIGINAAKTAMTKDMVKMVGAVDIDPVIAGKDLGEILGFSENLGISVVGDIQKIFNETNVDVVLHTTSSFVADTFDQFKTIMEGGANVISSTEELLLPDLKNPDKAKELDEIAKANNVTCLGTGVNPGFVMDTFVLCITSMCNSVEHVYAEREVDAATRRGPLQRKVGAGLTIEEFRALADAGKLGHIGMMESVAFVAKGLGWQLDNIEETLDPMVADRDIITQFVELKAGQAAGIKNTGTGYYKGEELIKLDLSMYVGARNPHDAIKITGDPPVDVVVNGGFHGDRATVASLVNNIPRVIKAPAGLCTMMDLLLPRIFTGKSNF